MKVSELTGDELDYWVAQIEGIPPESPLRAMAVAVGSINSYYPQYSTNWGDGGPIIERERIATIDADGDPKGEWFAYIPLHVSCDQGEGSGCYGETPLIAAMRAYVASKFGGEVLSQNSDG